MTGDRVVAPRAASRVSPLIAALLALPCLAAPAAAQSAESIEERARAKRERGDLDGAIADYGDALRRRPAFPEAYCGRGQARREMGDLAGAIADFTEALRLRSKYAEALHGRGLARAALRDLEGALADYDAALVYRDDPACYADRGDVKRELGDHAGAVADLTKSLRLRPGDVEALSRRSFARRLAGDLDGSLADADEIVRLRSGDARALLMRADVRRARGEDEAALADLDAAVRLGPNDPYLYMNRAQVRQLLGDLPGAMSDYDQAVKRAPQYYHCVFARGRGRALAGDLAGARADIERAIELDADDAYAPIWLAALFGETGPLERFADGPAWTASLARFCLGRITREQLLEEANAAPRPPERDERLCEAHGYAAMLIERAGDPADAALAREAYEACVATRVSWFIEWEWATARLAQLRAEDGR